MSSKEIFYPEAQFGGFTDIDGTVAFFSRVNSLLEPSFVVLDVGCGRGVHSEDLVQFRRNLRILKGKVSKVIGIDVDQAASKNQLIDEFHQIRDYEWPIDNSSVDMIVCDYVLEHVDDPDKFFAEIARVLKNGGFLCIRTPNQWSYVSIAATLIPNKYHSRITSYVQDARKDEDVFPTVYKCNSTAKLRRMMKNSGFEECVVYGYEAEPSYLSFSQLAYSFGVFHQRFAPKFLRQTLFSFGKIKKDLNP